LLGVTVDLDHGVVDIDEREPTPPGISRRRGGLRRAEPGQVGQGDQEP
jgi:hypothetical protein